MLSLKSAIFNDPFSSRRAFPSSPLPPGSTTGGRGDGNRMVGYECGSVLGYIEPSGELLAWVLRNKSNDGLGDHESNLPSRCVFLIGQIRDLSERIFPGPVSFEHASDPEDSSHQYIVFDVDAQGEFADYRDRIFKWHDEVEKLVPGAVSEFRLIVHPKQ